MTVPDVVIKYSELDTVITHLETIVTELREAGDRSGAIRDAIDSPWGRRELPDKAQDSESRWNTKRAGLADDLDAIRQHAQDIYDSFQEFDQDAAKNFESGEAAPA